MAIKAKNHEQVTLLSDKIARETKRVSNRESFAKRMKRLERKVKYANKKKRKV